MIDHLVQTDSFTLSLEPADPPAASWLTLHHEPGARRRFSLLRMIPSGPEVTLSATPVFDEQGDIRFHLFENLPDGLYLALLRPADDEPRALTPPLRPLEGGAPFWIGPDRPEDLSVAVATATAAQEAFLDREIRASGYEGSDRLALHVLMDGCLLDYRQKFEGGWLAPLPHRLGVATAVEAVNAILPPGFAFTETAGLAESHGRDHPLALVSFLNVAASEDGAAVGAIQPRLERILGALTLDRGASPIVVAYLLERPGDRYTMRLPASIYRGNLMPGFGPGVTWRLDQVERAARNDPWIEFALGLYRNVRLQIHPSEILFQAWALIEAAAKRAVPRDNAVVVLDDAGAAISTCGKDIGRVTTYLRSQLGPSAISAGLGPDLWSRASAVYGARNRIAHEGGINSPLNPTPPPDVQALSLLSRDWAEAVLVYELHRAAAG